MAAISVPAGGKVVAFAGEALSAWPSPNGTAWKRRWHSATGKAWKDLAPQRDKAIKIHRAYAVEAVR